MVPMRDLMALHAQTMGAEGTGIVSRIDNALGFMDQLLAANPIFARANPQAVERFSKIKDQGRNYVAHEYFNQDWKPMSFADMADWMAPAKVQWAASASYTDAVDAINLSAEQQTLLASIPEKQREALARAIPFKRFAKPSEVANAVLFFASGRSDYLTGQVLSVSGGLTMVD